MGYRTFCKGAERHSGVLINTWEDGKEQDACNVQLNFRYEFPKQGSQERMLEAQNLVRAYALQVAKVNEWQPSSSPLDAMYVEEGLNKGFIHMSADGTISACIKRYDRVYIFRKRLEDCCPLLDAISDDCARWIKLGSIDGTAFLSSEQMVEAIEKAKSAVN